jgi:DNA-binding MarR family transcriptional regulator
LDHSFHYLLMCNQAQFHKKLLDQLKGTELTIGQPKILDYLKDHDGANQKEIACACHIEAGTLTSLLSRMEEKGLVQRKMLNGNRRTLHVFLTPYGKQLQQSVENAFLQLECQAFHGISAEEQKIFMEIFERIYENIRKGES